MPEPATAPPPAAKPAAKEAVMESTPMARAMNDQLAANVQGIEQPSFLTQRPPIDSPSAPTPPAPAKPDTPPVSDADFEEIVPPKAGETPKPAVKKPLVDPDKLTSADIPDEPHGNTSEEGKIRWKENKAIAQRAEARAAEIQAKYDADTKALQEKLSMLPDLEEKAKRVEEAERRLAILNVRESAEFKAVVDAPLEAIGSRADQIAEKYEIDKDAMARAIVERDPVKRAERLEEIINGMSRIDEATVIRMSEDAQAVLAKSDELERTAGLQKAELERLTAEKETKAQRDNRVAFEAAAEQIVRDNLGPKIPFVPLVDGESQEAWLDGILKSVKGDESDFKDPMTRAFAATAAAMLPRMQKQLLHLRKEHAAAIARIKQLSGGSPSLVPETAGAGDPGDTPPGWYPGKR